MIKLSNLLNESIAQRNLTIDEVKSLLKTDYRDSSNLFKRKIRFYRGDEHENDCVEVFPSKKERTGLIGLNTYTVLLGHLPSWKKGGYPKRSRALIFTNDLLTTESYGDAYYVFPKNGAKLVMGSEDDMINDDGYPFALKNGFTIHDLHFHMDLLLSTFGKDNFGFPKKSTNKIKERDYEAFINMLNKYVTIEKIKKFSVFYKNVKDKEKYRDIKKILKSFVKTMSVHNGNWELFFDYLFNPEKNKIKLIPVESYNNNLKSFNGNEMWTDSDCLLIKRTPVWVEFLKSV